MKNLKQNSKGFIKTLLFVAVVAIILVISNNVLKAQDKKAMQVAIQKCGKNNIVQHYDNNGDLYFSCKTK